MTQFGSAVTPPQAAAVPAAQSCFCDDSCNLAAATRPDRPFIFLAAMIFAAAALSFLDALNFLSWLRSIAESGALPQIHLCFKTCSAVRRFFGSTVSKPLTKSFASCEMLSHQGEGKSYRPFRI